MVMNTISLVLVSYNRFKRTLKPRGTFETREAAEVERARLESFPGNSGEYRVLGPRQLKSLQAVIKGEQAARRAKGAVKAAATRKKNGKHAFVCCPTCGAKSRKLCSEFGGLQTRKCQRGHTFEHDKWLSDRAFWAPVLTGRVIPQGDITRPV